MELKESVNLIKIQFQKYWSSSACVLDLANMCGWLRLQILHRHSLSFVFFLTEIAITEEHQEQEIAALPSVRFKVVPNNSTSLFINGLNGWRAS